jgi:hypothetical protein
MSRQNEYHMRISFVVQGIQKAYPEICPVQQRVNCARETAHTINADKWYVTPETVLL